MPRPERVRTREADRAQAVAQGAQAEADVETPQNDAAIDNAEEPSQSARTGDIPEAELALSRTVARRFGWVPQDEWKRDPAKWQDADLFIKDAPTQIETLKERLKRTGQVAEAQAEEARQRGIREAQEQLRQAATAGDADGAERAAQNLARHSGPPPQTVAWMGRNPWFKPPGEPGGDPIASAAFIAAVNTAEKSGAGIEEALSAGERAVRERFPEHFGETRAEPQRLSEIRQAPQVQGGSRGAAPVKSKEKGWGDIPAGDRAQMERGVQRRAREYGKSADEMRAQTATLYWRNQA